MGARLDYRLCRWSYSYIIVVLYLLTIKAYKIKGIIKTPYLFFAIFRICAFRFLLPGAPILPHFFFLAIVTPP